MNNPDRQVGGVAPELEVEAIFVWDDPHHPGFHFFSHSEESAKQAHEEGLNPRRFEPANWPFLDDPPDPL